MSTPIYVKMDSSTPLLLSEGVCRQLGILSYHSSISVAKQNGDPSSTENSLTQESANADSPPEVSAQASVPMVRVALVQSVKLLPRQTSQVKVQLLAVTSGGPLLVEASSELESQGVYIEEGLVQAGHDDNPLLLTNRTGFTLELSSGYELGAATEVDVVSPVKIEDREESDDSRVNRLVSATEDNILRRKDRLLMFYRDTLQLPPQDKESFCDRLTDYHAAFCLDEGERGETDMVQLHIDTGDAQPRRQAPRRMPFVVRKEVDRQVQKMANSGVIKKSHSPWASPVRSWCANAMETIGFALTIEGSMT